MTHGFTALLGLGLAAAAAGYACFAVYAVVRGVRRASAAALWRYRQGGPPTAGLRPVSVLKPLCGAEPRLYENLRSFCEQEYLPTYQLVFGVREAMDPAIAVVERLRREFPGLDIQLVVDPTIHGANLKVSNLVNILPRAGHDWLVLADSDIAVPSDYLARVVAPLADPGVGVVTCLYRGIPVGSFWSRLGALFIDEWFAPSVQVAHSMGSQRFAFGSTIALRRETLKGAGGFEALRDTLADDFWLGELTRQRGLRTVLSDVVVNTDVTDTSLSSLWLHELRWLRTIRALERAGFSFTFVTFTFPLLALGLLLSPHLATLAAALPGATARLVIHYLQRQSRRDSRSPYEVMLTPLRDILLLAEWAVALTGWRVRWQNQVMHASGAPVRSQS